ncbi:hypothetical protein [Sinorhizobium sp. KGO-5]|uniref:hypothetical protein n=1 Tax=Sinorhizobium sp. KGO-5 TaxID=1470810 RepID=UPI00403EEF83
MFDQIGDLRPVLQAIVALYAWNEPAVLHAPWVGRLLSGSLERCHCRREGRPLG